jgi:hypothetical protein
MSFETAQREAVTTIDKPTTTQMSQGIAAIDDAISTVSRSTNRSSSDNLYEVIEYDLADTDHNPNRNKDAFDFFPSVKILENSPAAEALRANASVRVSKAGKAARAVHMQTVRRGLKYIAGKHQHGVRKGKPPRVPPSIFTADGEDDDRSNSIIEEESELASELDDAERERDEAPPSDEEIKGEDEKKKTHDGDDDGDQHHDEEESESESGFEVEPVPYVETPPGRLQQQQLRHAEDDLNHMPENVAPGTVEAGKKGTSMNKWNSSCG